MTDPTQTATWHELQAQPGIWADWAQALPVAELRGWVAGLGVDQVWFCGAGSSAFVGDMVVAALEGQGRFRAVATTDIVARPAAYLTGVRPLIVSFGRSGNSAETIGTLDAADALAPDAPRLNITCNAQGALATRAAPGAQRTVVLPAATHDAGFAMTSSLTTMLLTALAIFSDHGTDPIAAMARELTRLLPIYAGAAGPVPARAVFVGSGPLAFAARESALKVMELTAGQVPALWDSTLGFRHGPKSFVQGATAICVLTHPDPHTARYDADLVTELRRQFPAARVLAVGPGGDIDVAMTDAGYGAALVVPLAQIMAVTWSAALGLNVDDPFAGQGTLSRVVSGVRLYPVHP